MVLAGVGTGRGHRPEPARAGAAVPCQAKGVDTNPPVACSLSSTDARTRQAEWSALLRDAARSRTPVPGGIRVELTGDVRSELIRLVELERECCPFLELVVEESAAGGLVLTATAPPDAEALVDELLS